MNIPPHSTEAEMGLLGSVLLAPHTELEKANGCGIEPDHFYDKRHQLLWESISGMDGERMDAVLIGQILNDAGNLERIGGYDYLTELEGAAIITGHLESYAAIVIEKHRARKLAEAAEETLRQVYDGESPGGLILGLSNSLDGLQTQKSTCMETTLGEAKEEMERIIRGEVVSLPFPWANFQRATFGIPIGAVTPLMGRDKTGKSRLAMTMVKHWITLPEPIPTLVFSFEDGTSRYLQAMASTLGEYDGFGVRDRPTDSYIEKARLCLDKISGLPLYVVQGSLNAEDICFTIAAYRRKFGIQAVVIDGFKDINSSKGENRTSEENHMFETIKHGALKHGVGVICIEHTHDVEDGKWLSKRNMRGSKQRSQSARMVLIYQDCGFPDGLATRYGEALDEIIALDCCACNYGTPSIVVLRPELEAGRFVECVPN